MTTPARFDLPAVSGEQMAAVDRAMFDVCGLDVLQVMEVAGRAIAVWIRREIFGGSCAGKQVAVLCGPGGNGGDGLVAAKYLQQWGATPAVALAANPKTGSPAAHQLSIARILGIMTSMEALETDAAFDLVIDGLLGFGGSGAPRERFAALIRQANAHAAPTVAIDLPSGLNATTGERHSPCISAFATVTLGLPKTGLLARDAEQVTGRVVVADIGIPALAFSAAGVDVPAIEWQDDFIELGWS